MASPAFDLSGLRPLDVNGLLPADPQSPPQFDVSGLKPIDVTGLTAANDDAAVEFTPPLANTARFEPDYQPRTPQPAPSVAPPPDFAGTSMDRGPIPEQLPAADLAAPRYEEPRGIVQRVQDNVGPALHSVFEVTPEQREQYPHVAAAADLVKNTPPGLMVDAALRAPNVAIGGASGLVAGIAERYGLSPTDADRLQQDVGVALQGALVESGQVRPEAPRIPGIGRSSPEEIQSFLGEAQGRQSRAEIDAFLRQREAQEAPATPALEAPRVAEGRPPLNPEGLTPIDRPASDLSARAAPAPETILQPELNQPPQAAGIVQPVAPPAPPAPPLEPPGRPLPAVSLQDMLNDPRSADEIRAEMQAARDWQPTAEWQPVPQGAVLTPDLQVEVNPDTGARRARLAPAPGSREAPVQLETPQDVHVGAEQTAQPTPAQAEAGNYQKRHVNWRGLDISVETEAGMERTGMGPDGKPWSVEMPVPYGHALGTKGADGDPVDIYIGPNPASPKVFVIDQIDPASFKFDEHKALIGFSSDAEARQAYEAAFSDGSGPDRLGETNQMSAPAFKAWLKNGNTKKAISYQPPVMVKERSKRQNGPQSLFEFIAARGGVNSIDPLIADVRQILGGKNRFIPGYGAIIRPTGQPLDRLREAAVEAGYLEDAGFNTDAQSTSYVNHLLDAMDNEARGQKHYSVRDLAEIQEREAKLKAEESADRVKEAEDEIRSVATAEGLGTLTDAELHEASMMTLNDGADALDAIVNILERNAVASEAQQVETAQSEIADARQIRATGTDAAGAIPAQAVERAGLEREAAAGEAPARLEHGEDQPDRGEATTERTPAGEQSVLPGAEKAPDRALAQRAADKPLKPKTAQQPMDVGMFGDSAAQTDLVEMARKPPPTATKPAQNITENITAPAEAPKAGPSDAIKRLEALNVTAAKSGPGLAYDRHLAEHEQEFHTAIAEARAQLKGKKSAYIDGIEARLRAAPGNVMRSVNDAAREPPRPSAIADFGEKIEGARKDTFAGFRDALKEEVDLATEPLSKSFPQPNYEKLAAEGVPKRALAYIAIMRDMIPPKPRQPYKVRQWAGQVQTLRGFARQLLDREIDVAKLNEAASKNHVLSDMPLTAEAIEDVAAADLPKAAEYRISSGSYSMLNGQRFSPSKTFWHLEGPRRRLMRNPLSNDPAMQYTHRETAAETVALAKKIIEHELAKQPEQQSGERSKYTDVGVYRDRAKNEVFLGFKVRSSVIRLKAGFEDTKAAREYLQENRDELQGIIDEMRKGPNMRGTENRPRSGESLREGDVTPDSFSSAFGFRGVQFGNYVEGGRRQADLNRAFDALMDLADVLGIPPRALSLNGSLGLAFGARGHGGRDAAAAHYEPGQIVINLTKGGGPGSLAHEWLHALDNYFARQDKASGYISERKRDAGPVRDVVYQAWKGIESSLAKGSFADRSAKFDETRAKPYWGTTIEKAARAFERYVIDRLSDRGAINDYLANIDTAGGAYPTEKEMQSLGIRAAFDQLFNALETKETDKGIALASALSRAETAPLTAKAAQHRADIASMLTDIIHKMAGREVKVEFQQGERLTGETSDRIASEGATGYATEVGRQRPQATYIPARRVIEIALGATDPVSNAFHEAWHDVEMHLLDDREIKLLTNQTEPLRKVLTDAFGVSKEDAAQFAGYEVRAHAFQEYARAREQGKAIPMHGSVRALFERIWQAMKRIANGLRGVGFKTVEDVFGKAFEGEYRNRLDRGARSLDSLASVLDPLDPKAVRDAVAKFDVPSEIIADHLEARNLPKLAEISRATGTRKYNLGRANTTETRVVLQDKFLRWQKIQNAVEKATGEKLPEALNTYMAESLYYGRTGERLERLEKDQIDPLIAEIKSQGLTLDEVNRYLMARHAPERNARMPAGMTDTQAARIIEEIDESGKRKAYNAVETSVRAIINKTLDNLVEGGLISEDTYNTWKEMYEHYVPLRGFADAEIEDAMHGDFGKGYDVRGPESKAAKGRKSLADGPLSYVMLQAEQAIVRAEKAKVGRTAMRFVNANPSELWSIVKGAPPFGAQNVFALKVRGEPYYIDFKGEYGTDLARALKNLGTANMHSAVRLIAAFTRIQARLATSLNPDFLIPNMARDLGEAFINMQEQEQKKFVRQFVKHLPRAMPGVFQALTGREGGKYAEAFREFDKAGGRIRFFGMENVDDIKANVAKKMRRLEGGAVNKLRDAGGKALEAIEIANATIENATRLAAYMAARDVGLSQAKSASIAKEMTVNFNRKGEWGSVISALYMFANASIQGQTRMVSAMHNKKVRRGAYALAAAGAALALYNIMAGGDDKDGVPFYLKVPHWTRDTNMVLMWPKGMGHDGEHIKIPLPYGYSFFHVIGARLTGLALGKEKPAKAIGAVASSVLDAFDPLGKDENTLAQFTPSIMRPAVHISTNKNWTGRPINPEAMPWNRSEPDSSRSFRSASEFSKVAATKLNQVTGGNKHEPGMVDVSPGTIDYWLKFVTGGLGQFVNNSVSTGVRAYEGQEWQVDKTPIVRRFMGQVDPAADRALYFEERDAVKSAWGRLQAFQKDRDPENVARFRRENAAEIALHEVFAATDKRRGFILKQIDKLKSSDDLSSAEKERRIKLQETKEIEDMARARKLLDERRARTSVSAQAAE